MAETNNVAALLEAGIKAEGLRQKAIASNIANLETPGYRRISVKFEDLLSKALKSSGEIRLSDIEPETYQPNETPVKSNGNDVNLEVEVGEMLKNSLRHKTFVVLLKKKYMQIALAMGGK
jgi:flagellar basal-body rod protein FlgB